MVCAGCTGEQDINRAELLIIVIVIASEAFSAFKLYTDSSTAQSAWDLVSAVEHPTAWQHHPNFWSFASTGRVTKSYWLRKL